MMGAEKAKKAETEKAKKPEKAKAATEAEAKPAKKAKQAEQCQAAAETAKQAEMSFAAASGLAAIFGALNLNEDVRVRCLARTVQWFQELGVRLARAAPPHADERSRAECPRDPQSAQRTAEHSQYSQYPEYRRVPAVPPQCRRVPCCRAQPLRCVGESTRVVRWAGSATGELAGKASIHVSTCSSAWAETCCT